MEGRDAGEAMAALTHYPCSGNGEDPPTGPSTDAVGPGCRGADRWGGRRCLPRRKSSACCLSSSPASSLPPYPRCCDERAAAGRLRLGVTYGSWNKAAYMSGEVRNARRNSGYMLHSSLAYTGPGAVVGVGVLLAGVPLPFLARRHYQ